MKNLIFVLSFLLCASYVVPLDSIFYVNYGGKIPAEDPFDIFIRYQADDYRLCFVSLNANGEVYASSSSISLTKGLNQTKGITLTRPLNMSVAPIGAGYQIVIQLFDGNNVQTTSFLQNVTVESGKQGFYSYNDKIYDGNSEEFLMRGVNNPHIYWDINNQWISYNTINRIVLTGSNVVRVNWLKYLPNGLVASDLDRIIARYIQYNLVPILSLHDSTSSTNASILLELAQYWADNIELLIKYRKYIIVNIANEWWGTSPEMWRDSYKAAITIIRDAGFSGALIVDGNTNQSPVGVKLYAKSLIEYDRFHSLIFSIHIYAQWDIIRQTYKLLPEFAAIKSLSIPFILGEFGQDFPVTMNNGTTRIEHVDSLSVMSLCTSLGFGYLAWDWAPRQYNGPDQMRIMNQQLHLYYNVSNSSAVNNYTSWGDNLINTPLYGIKATSKLATIF